MDPKKLAAVMGDKSPAPAPGKPGKPQGGKPGKPGKNPHEDVHPDMDEGDETAEDEGDELDGDLKQYAELVKALESEADAVEEACDGLDPEFLTDSSVTPDDEQKSELQDAIDTLPDDLVTCLREHAAGISWDDSMSIASHLEDEGMIPDAESVAGFIFHAGQLLGSGDGDQDKEQSDAAE